MRQFEVETTMYLVNVFLFVFGRDNLVVPSFMALPSWIYAETEIFTSNRLRDRRVLRIVVP